MRPEQNLGQSQSVEIQNIPVEFLSKRQHGAEILRRNSFEAATVPGIVSDTQLGAQQ